MSAVVLLNFAVSPRAEIQELGHIKKLIKEGLWLTAGEELRQKGSADAQAREMAKDLEQKVKNDADLGFENPSRSLYADAYIKYFSRRYGEAKMDLKEISEKKLGKAREKEIKGFLIKAQGQKDENLEVSSGKGGLDGVVGQGTELAGYYVEDPDMSEGGVKPHYEQASARYGPDMALGPQAGNLELVSRAVLQLTMANEADEKSYREALIAYSHRDYDKACGIVVQILNHDPENDRCKKAAERIDKDMPDPGRCPP